MRSFIAVVALAASVYAQGLENIPSCGIQCVGNSLSSTGCSNLDIACICKSSGWIDQLSCCISTGCSSEDQQTIINFANQICATAGVTNLPQAAGCSASGSASGTASRSGAVSSAAASASAAVSSAAGSISSAVESIASSVSEAASSATAASGNVAPTNAAGMGIAAAAGLLALAL